MSKKHNYVYSLDAIRSIAMIGVMLFHMLPTKVPGGFLGVVTFLVMAGYLSMRAIIMDGIVKNPFRAFWSKIKKLMPALITMTFITLMVVTFFLSEYLPGMKSQAVASILGVNNIVQIIDGESYFAAVAEVKPFTHIWALSLELQFYALLLFTAGWLYRAEHKKWWGLLFAAITIFSIYMINALFTNAEDVTRIYYGPDTRVFSFSIGVLGALIFADKKKHVIANGAIHSILVFALITLSFACFFVIKNSETVYRYIFVLYSFLQLLLIYLCSSKATFAYRLLSSPPFRAIAARSYAFYLCHFPIVKIFEKLMWGSKLNTAAYIAFEIAIIIIVTEFFYLIFKQSALLKTKLSKRTVKSASTLCLAAMVATVFWMPYKPHGDAIERYEKLEMLRTSLNIPSGCLDIGISTPKTSEAPAVTNETSSIPTTTTDHVNTDTDITSDDSYESSSNTNNTDSTETSAEETYTDAVPPVTTPISTPAYINNDADIETVRALFEEWKPEFPQISMTFDDYLQIRNKKITLIGDSISVMIADRFVQFFPNAQISAQVNRQSYHAYEFYSIMKSEGRIGEIVILALGANGHISYETFDQVRADTDMPMLITSVILPWPVTESERNTSVHEYARSRNGVGVIRWNEMCKDKTWLLYDDGVHPKDSGAIAYTFVIMDAVYSALSSGLPVVTTTEPTTENTAITTTTTAATTTETTATTTEPTSEASTETSTENTDNADINSEASEDTETTAPATTENTTEPTAHTTPATGTTVPVTEPTAD